MHAAPMGILCRLETQAARALSRAIPQQWSLRNTATLRQLLREAESGRHDVVVLDPLDRALRERCYDTTAANLSCLHRTLCLPIVLFTPLTVEALDAVVAMAHHCRVSVVYRLDDDRVAQASDAIERAAAARLGVRVLHALERAARVPLSGIAASAVEHLFYEPGAFRRTGETLAAQGINQAILNAELRRAGLESVHVLRRIARVAHAYQLVSQFDASLKDVVRRVGAGSIDSLNRETKLLTSFTTGQLCARLRADELAELAVRAACPATRESLQSADLPPG